MAYHTLDLHNKMLGKTRYPNWWFFMVNTPMVSQSVKKKHLKKTHLKTKSPYNKSLYKIRIKMVTNFKWWYVIRCQPALLRTSPVAEAPARVAGAAADPPTWMGAENVPENEQINLENDGWNPPNVALNNHWFPLRPHWFPYFWVGYLGVGRRSPFLLGPFVTFQGPTVKLREGIPWKMMLQRCQHPSSLGTLHGSVRGYA